MSTLQSVLQKLEQFNLKEEGQDTWRCNSPFRPDSDSRAFKLTASDGEHGAWYDHVSEEHGSLRELAKKLGINLEPVPGPIPIENSKRLYKDGADYAQLKGVDWSVLEKAGWVMSIWHEGGVKRPAIKIPTDGGDRYRLLDATEKPFRSSKGYTRSWYKLDHAIVNASRLNAPLVICNGEPSTVIAQEFGIPATCITAGEKESIPQPLLNRLIEKYPVGGRIIVAFDCDDTGRRCALGVANQLSDAGYQAWAVDLELGQHGDLADYCKLGPKDALARLSTQRHLSVQPPRKSARRWWLKGTEIHNMPDQKWLVKDLIPVRGLVTMYGPPGVGKTFLALSIALNIANEYTVVYFASEGELGYKARVAAWCQHQKAATSLEKFVLVGGSLSLLDASDKAAFLEEARLHHPMLIVVDTLANTMLGGDENSTRDMGKYLQGCKDLSDELGCAILLVHHTNKSGEWERGNSSLRGRCDVMISLTEEDGTIKVKCEKTKDAIPFPERVIRLLKVADSTVAVEAADDGSDPSRPLSVKQLSILRLLVQTLYEDEGAGRADIEQELKISRGTFTKAMSRLLDLQLVEKPEYGKYRITPAGTEKVTQIAKVIASEAEVIASEGAGDRLESPSDHLKNASDHLQNGTQTPLPELPARGLFANTIAKHVISYDMGA